MARFGKIGWFFGLLFGAVIGILFAPQKGKDLRAKIKSERKKGKLGIAPLQDDMKQLGRDIAQIAKEICQSEAVSAVVEKGRAQLKSISDELVGEVADFHKSRIAPFQKDAIKKADDLKKAAARGEREFRTLAKKVKKSAKIGRRAVKEIKKTLRKKQP